MNAKGERVLRMTRAKRERESERKERRKETGKRKKDGKRDGGRLDESARQRRKLEERYRLEEERRQGVNERRMTFVQDEEKRSPRGWKVICYVRTPSRAHVRLQPPPFSSSRSLPVRPLPMF